MNAIAKALHGLPAGNYVLAVSGGRDSMALLHAFATVRRHDLSAVATFDHGTGAFATAAAEFVIRECLVRSIPVIPGRARPAHTALERTESAWREARWTFLRDVARERRATIATAHTLDDQAETVAMRVLRDASARGLAAMAAPSPGIVRPLLGVRRAVVARYASAEQVPFIDDPTNADPAYLRNRLRADLLRAAELARPGFIDDLAALGTRAGRWRAELAALVDGLGVRLVGDAVVVDAESLASLQPEGLAIVWPELAGRVGVVMERRGIARLAAWTRHARPGQQAPLSGGAQLVRTARTFVLRQPPVTSAGISPEAC